MEFSSTLFPQSLHFRIAFLDRCAIFETRVGLKRVEPIDAVPRAAPNVSTGDDAADDDPSQRFRRVSSRAKSARPYAKVATPTGYVSPKLVGRRDEVKGGRGVFARVEISAGEMLVVWGGEIVTAGQLAVLPKAQRHRLCLQVEEGLFLMTTREGPSDWVNHSCDPNAGLCGQIVLVAMRPIEPGEEICFDYAMTDSYPYDEFDCQCRSPICRRRITGNDWRIEDLQKRYVGFFSPYLEQRIGRERLSPGDEWSAS
jgi:hypothetical protein